MRDIGNLVFIALALIAWIIKEVVERKQAGNAPAPDASPPPGRGPGRTSPVDAGSGEVDVVYGRRPVPDALTAGPVPTPSAGASLASAPRTEQAQGAAPTLGVLRGSPRLGSSRLGTALSTAAAMGDPGRRSSARAWVRLGLRAGRPQRQLVRSGILWSEVLGAPRAFRGPHRHDPRRTHV